MSATTITTGLDNFKFSLSAKEAKEILEKIPSTQKEFIRMVERAAVYGVERLILLQESTYLTDLYNALAPRFQKPFSAWVQRFAPVNLTKDADKKPVFRFAMKSLKDMAAKNDLTINFDDSGKCLNPEELRSLMLVVRTSMTLDKYNWANPTNGEAKEKKALTADDIAEAFKKLVKKAESNNIDMASVHVDGLPASTPQTFMGILSMLFEFADNNDLSEDERAIVDMVMSVATAKSMLNAA